MEILLECYHCHQNKDPFEVEFKDILIDGVYQPICKSCLDENYFTCSHCDRLHPVTSRIVHNEKVYCRECFDYLYVVCSECQTVIRRGEARTSGNRIYCMECFRQGEILSNGYKPEPKFRKMSYESHERYMGVELEIDGGSDQVECSKEVHKVAKKDSYNKYDGSLRSGFEIVTHPMTLDYHTKKYPWENVMKTVMDKGYKSHNTKTCGLHVHLSRKAFGEEPERDFNTMKLVMFFEKNWDALVKFSRRRPEALNSWARRFGVYVDGINRKDMEGHWKNCKCDGNRYHAVNLCNRNTIEIRIFRGTLVHNTMLATLQFLDLLMQRIPELSFEEVQEYDFTKVIVDAKKLGYNELVEYCKERKVDQVEKIVVEIPKANDIVEITGRIYGGPERSGRLIGSRGRVIRLSSNPNLEADAGGILCRFEFGEIWARPSSLRIVRENETAEENVERKSE